MRTLLQIGDGEILHCQCGNENCYHAIEVGTGFLEIWEDITYPEGGAHLHFDLPEGVHLGFEDPNTVEDPLTVLLRKLNIAFPLPMGKNHYVTLDDTREDGRNLRVSVWIERGPRPRLFHFHVRESQALASYEDILMQIDQALETVE